MGYTVELLDEFMCPQSCQGVFMDDDDVTDESATESNRSEWKLWSWSEGTLLQRMARVKRSSWRMDAGRARSLWYIDSNHVDEGAGGARDMDGGRSTEMVVSVQVTVVFMPWMGDRCWLKIKVSSGATMVTDVSLAKDWQKDVTPSRMYFGSDGGSIAVHWVSPLEVPTTLTS
ncbi:hypothetical protein DYB28_012800, partial [Aphanomyces astaci]